MLNLHFAFRLAAVVLAGSVIMVVIGLVLRGDFRRAIPFAILSWGVSETYAEKLTLVYHTDPNGVRSFFGFTSLILAITFAGLLAKERGYVSRFLRTPMFVAFYVLFACAVLSQSWYLGPLPGIAIAYARVLQPMMVVALMAYLGESESGLRRAFVWMIASVGLAIALRYAASGSQALAPAGTSTLSASLAATGGVARVYGLGSWTIYGTICAAILPMVVALIVVDRRWAVRLVLVLVAVAAVKEVLATGTRGAVVGFAAVLLFLLRRGARRWVVTLVAAALLCALVFGVGAAFSGNRTLSFRLGDMLRQPNVQARFERNLAAIHYVMAHPLSGSGLGLPLRVDGVDIGTWVYNPYLAWGVAMGLLALMAFAAIVGMAVVHCIGNWRASAGGLRTLQVALAATLAVWLLNQFTTGDSLTYLQSTQASFFFYAVVGLIYGSWLARRRPGSSIALRVS